MSANDHQVGGTHYQQHGKPQHWDLAIMYKWDPFQYQITKYMMRWKTKFPTPQQKLADLKKAAHFLEKYIENYEAYLPEKYVPDEAPNRIYTKDQEAKIEQKRNIVTQEMQSFREHEKNSAEYTSSPHYLCEGGWGNNVLLYTCQYCRKKLTGFSLIDVHEKHDHECSKEKYYEMGRVATSDGQTTKPAEAERGGYLPSILGQGGRSERVLAGAGHAARQDSTRPVDEPGASSFR